MSEGTLPVLVQNNVYTVLSVDPMYTERPDTSGLTGNTAWVAGLAVYVPFVINQACTVFEWFWYNGTVATAHNIDFGIYREDFTAIQRLGGAAGLTTASTVVGTTTWTDLVLNPGAYYMAMSGDSTRNFITDTGTVTEQAICGIMEQTSAYPLPDPMVPVYYTRAFRPVFGLNLRSVVL